MEKLGLSRHTSEPDLPALHSRYQAGEISAAELTSFCLLPDVARKPQSFQKSALKDFKNIPTGSELMDFLLSFSWKGHSDRIRTTLINWHLGHYPLVLWNKIPTPLELLKIQAQGQRVITLFDEASAWTELHFGKTAWDFTVHDLMHASHFFEDSDLRAGQIDFYNLILKKWDHPLIEILRQDFSAPFEYIISDMNSHPQHMLQTLKALALMAFKKKAHTPLNERLPALLEAQFQNEFTKLSNAKEIS